MDKQEFLSVCHRSEQLICYGAGYYAKHLTFFLNSMGLEVKMYCVTDLNDNVTVFLGKKVIPSTKLSWYKKNTLVIVAVSEEYHKEIRKILEDHYISNTYFIRDSFMMQLVSSDEHKRHIVLSWILHNETNHKIKFFDIESFETKILHIRTHFRKVEIRYLRAYSIVNVIEGLCYYLNNNENDGETFLLLYPTDHDSKDKPYHKKFQHPNHVMLKKFNGNFFEALNDENIYFWKYFIIKYPEFFYDNVSRMVWLNSARKHSALIKSGNCWKLGKRYLDFSNKEINNGNELLRKWIPSNKYICIYARDPAYYRNIHENTNTYSKSCMNKFRNSNIMDFAPLCSYFKDKGIYSVRIGYCPESSCKMDGCIDYAWKYRDAFMDIYLQSKCEFVIGDDGGALSFGTLFDTPIVYINNLMLTSHNLEVIPPRFFEKDLTIMVKLWDQRKNRFLTLREMLKYEMFSMEDEDDNKPNFDKLYVLYHENGIIPVKNTSAEILDVAIEMYERQLGIRVYDELDEELQQRYLIIAHEGNEFEKRYWQPARMGASFLRNNQWLLD